MAPPKTVDAEGAKDQDASLNETEEELARLKAELASMEADEGANGSKDAANGGTGAKDDAMATDDGKGEVDSRSVYVGSVDYAVTPEELSAHFNGCGTVNRVTILTDKGGNPKGFAYVEFLEASAVESACLLDGSELKGRKLKVSPKRTNVPGMKQHRGRGRGRGGMPFNPMMAMMASMMGANPYMMQGGGRGRGRGRRGGRGRGGGGGYSPY